jgi:DNA-binding response OmpR family regulator
MKSFPFAACTIDEQPLSQNSDTEDQSRDVGFHSPENQEVSPNDPNHSGSASFHHHILVVDDDAEVRELLASILRLSGYQVSCAYDGEAAWEALCADCFDALITDHAMPRLTGLDLLRRVRAGRLNALPVILISGEMPDEEENLLELVRPGLTMEKPFSFITLLTNVGGLLATATRAKSGHDGRAPREFVHQQALAHHR